MLRGSVPVCHRLLEKTARTLMAAVGAILLMGDARADGGEGLRLLDAVRITIERQATIQSQEQTVETYRGLLQEQSGAFDTTLESTLGFSHEDVPNLTGVQELTETTTAQVGVSKLFRNGVSIGPNVQLLRTDAPPVTAQDASTVNFQIDVPLLKGLGTSATGALERSAREDYQGSLYTYRHTIAQEVLATVSAYWDYLSAVRTLEQRIVSEARAEQHRQDIKKLIEGDELAASEMEQIAANLASKTALRFEAERGLVSAKHTLGLAMGTSFEEIEALPSPADPFPSIQPRELEKAFGGLSRIVSEALAHRADYLASGIAQESARILVEQAKNNLLPQLDLQVGVGYSGLERGTEPSRFFSSLANDIPGYSASVNLTYKWPVQNNTARGILLQKQAAFRQAEIQSKELARTISSSVSQDLSDLRNRTLEFIKFDESVGHYRKAVENEKRKYLLAMSTLSDLLTTEDNLTDAVLGKISAEGALAKALAQLRFDTGTILALENERISVGMKEVATVPFVDPSGTRANGNGSRQ
ncbi:MAG: TolC family protein [Acidobacteriota bacterium]